MNKMLLVPSGLFTDRLDTGKEKMSQLDHEMEEILERQDIDEDNAQLSKCHCTHKVYSEISHSSEMSVNH